MQNPELKLPYTHQNVNRQNVLQEQPSKLQMLVSETAARQRGHKAKGHKSVEAASVKLTATASDAQRSDAQKSDSHGSMAQSADLTDEEPGESQQPEEIMLTQQAEPDFADPGADLHQLQAEDVQFGQQQLPQHEDGTQQQAGLQQQQVPIAIQHSESQPADVSMLMQQQQQRQIPVALLPGFLDVLRKEPLCLRVRPLDALTKRLMQALDCTALLEMPNNK